MQNSQSVLCRRAFWILPITGLLACASPRVVPSAPAAPRPSVPSSKTVSAWTPILATDTAQYLVTDSAIVSIAVDTSSKQLPIVSSTLYGLALTRLNDSILVHLERKFSSVNKAGGTTRDTISTLLLSARATFEGRLSKLQPIEPKKCGEAIIPATVRIFDLLIPLPPGNSPRGTGWVDTIEVTVCHGKISLQQHTIRKFIYAADTTWQSQHAVLIKKTAETTVTGLEPDSLDRISASGSGLETASIIVSRTTGQLLESVENADLSLQITTSRGIFPFHEHLTSHLEHR